jgi:hypothetical protein
MDYFPPRESTPGSAKRFKSTPSQRKEVQLFSLFFFFFNLVRKLIDISTIFYVSNIKDGEDDHGEERRIARRKRASTQIAPIPRLDQMPPPTSHMDGHDFFHPSSLDPSGMLLMDSQLHEVNFDPSRAAHHTAPPRAVSQPIPPITHNPTKRRKKASAEPFRSGGPAGLTSDEDEEEKPKTASAEMERNLWRTVQSKGRSTVSTRQRNAAADNLSFLERLMGDVNHRKTTTLITSPWSSTILKPFIRRDDVSVPIPSGLDALWFLEEHDKLAHRVPIRVRLLRELLHKRNGNIPGWLLPTHTIDYCYLRADMVDQVNRLLCNEFWPGIDSTFKVTIYLGTLR